MTRPRRVSCSSPESKLKISVSSVDFINPQLNHLTPGESEHTFSSAATLITLTR